MLISASETADFCIFSRILDAMPTTYGALSNQGMHPIKGCYLEVQPYPCTAPSLSEI